MTTYGGTDPFGISSTPREPDYGFTLLDKFKRHRISQPLLRGIFEGALCAETGKPLVRPGDADQLDRFTHLLLLVLDARDGELKIILESASRDSLAPQEPDEKEIVACLERQGQRNVRSTQPAEESPASLKEPEIVAIGCE